MSSTASVCSVVLDGASVVAAAVVVSVEEDEAAGVGVASGGALLALGAAGLSTEGGVTGEPKIPDKHELPQPTHGADEATW